MIFNPTGSEVPMLFVEVFERAFDLEFQDYLTNEGRGFIAVVVSNDNPAGLLAAQCGIDKRSASTLVGDVMKLGQLDGFGAYFTPSRFRNAPLTHDVLLIQQRWLNLNTRGRTAIAYHEACHCFRDSRAFSDFQADSVEISKARKLRKFTQYAYEDQFGHDDQWFALIVAKAKRLHSAYSHIFGSIPDMVTAALNGDLDAEALMEEAPDLLEGAA